MLTQPARTAAPVGSGDLAIPTARVAWILWADPQAKLPYDYREHVQSWIYSRCLAGTEIGRKLHSPKYTLFTFALLPQMPQWHPDGLMSLNGAWELHVGSAYREVLALVQAHAALADGLSVAGVEFDSVELCAWPLADKSRFSVGPITVTDKDTKKFLHYDDPRFNEAVAAGLANRYVYFYGKDPGPISFSFVSPPQKKLIQYKNWNYIAWSGICTMKASLSVRKFAQQVGLGRRPSCGFGMLF